MYADNTTMYFNLDDFDHLTKETDINREFEKSQDLLKKTKQTVHKYAEN